LTAKNPETLRQVLASRRIVPNLFSLLVNNLPNHGR
jgi:hypothetical protein